MNKYFYLIVATVFYLFNAQNAFGQIITTVAGNGINGYCCDGSAATAAELNNPAGVAVDAVGNIYIADYYNNIIRKITPSGIIITIAGNGTAGFGGDGGSATAAELRTPSGVTMDAIGNIYISDYSNNIIRRVTPAGIISTIAGNGTPGFSGDGGNATNAELDGPYGVVVDAIGNIYFTEDFNGIIRKVTPVGIISTIAAGLSYPKGIALDATGNIYIADDGNNRIRKVTLAGIISTLAGNGISGFSGDGGNATNAELNSPRGVVVDAIGNIYISDDGNHRIRTVTPAGIISTLAGNGSAGFSGDGGNATMAELYNPRGVAVDATGNIYIADWDNNRIRKVTPGSLSVATLAPSSSFTLFQTSNSTLTLSSTPTPTTDIDITITDLTGRAIVHDFWLMGNDTKQIHDNCSLAKGMYLVRLTGQNTYTVLKWVKE